MSDAQKFAIGQEVETPEGKGVVEDAKEQGRFQKLWVYSVKLNTAQNRLIHLFENEVSSTEKAYCKD